MHRFWDISANRSQMPKFDLSDLEDNIDITPMWSYMVQDN